MLNIEKYDAVKKSIADTIAKMEIRKSKIEDIDKKLEDLNNEFSTISKCQDLAQIVAQGIQQKAHEKIASVVSKCLESVFEEPYKFSIIFDRKRGKTEARLVFERDGLELDPLTSSGGGVIDVASFALRLSAIILSKPKSRRIMIMDEPFRFLSAKYRPKIKELLSELSQQYNFQFVMVTHAQELVMGKVITL